MEDHSKLKSFFYALTVISSTCAIQQVKAEDSTCESFGGTTSMQQEIVDVGVGTFIKIGEPQKVCTFVSYYDNARLISKISSNTLLSSTPNLASTAYRTAPNPRSVTAVMKSKRADIPYCEFLGGTARIGQIGLSGGWAKTNPDGTTDDVDKMCVFSDGSMISTWTLFYKRLEDASSTIKRTDFTPMFQNTVIPNAKDLW